MWSRSIGFKRAHRLNAPKGRGRRVENFADAEAPGEEDVGDGDAQDETKRIRRDDVAIIEEAGVKHCC